ncbi:MAG: redoxin domain-containing protein, partial [Alphaproteobacteria bacterium]|nr:redoxin domain-containing protein [Alphaproteobacteria bacterium]
DIKAHDKFIGKHQLKIPLLSDPDTVTCQAYGVWVEKSMYGRKYMGVERSTFLIDANGNISNIWRKVKVPNHEQEILNVLKGG